MEKYTLWPQVGNLEVSGRWNGIGTDHPVAVFSPDSTSDISEGEIDTYESEWTPQETIASFESGLQSVKDEYQRWLQRMPAVSTEFGPGAELAAYIDWSAVVAPKGYLDRPTMLMSKNWMAMVWSWDHGFNAMAAADKDPELAWQQFMVLFDNQEANGALPDGMRENFRLYTYSKPPIHGWFLAWMMRHGQFSDEKHLREAYGPLVKWTEWYFRYQDSNHNGLPEYSQGNDSGWDNSTVFLKGVPVETPDLSAFLVLQMDTLATIAEKLGKQDEAKEWHKRSQTLLAQLLDRFWKGDHFVAIRAVDDSVVDSDSLLLYIPIILGNKLPFDVQQKLVSGLMRPGRFRTAHGFATEALTSPFYTPDGYWRGPIWAPSSMLLAEGLDSMGQKKIAHDLRKDFCEMAQKSGMAENYDANTGRGLRDPAYTWTSSVYLIFAHQLWSDNSNAK
jgi:glycogen debranching enzyme